MKTKKNKKAKCIHNLGIKTNPKTNKMYCICWICGYKTKDE